jgi:hypothetical protein
VSRVDARADHHDVGAAGQAGQPVGGIAVRDAQTGGDVLRSRDDPRDLLAQPEPRPRGTQDAAVGDDTDDVEAGMPLPRLGRRTPLTC